jgi:hypothetical protein
MHILQNYASFKKKYSMHKLVYIHIYNRHANFFVFHMHIKYIYAYKMNQMKKTLLNAN